MEKKDQVSIDVGKLVKSLRNEMEILHPLSENCCIYRVSKRLRQLNEKAYAPQAVSIGPLHRGKQALKAIEEHKTRYLHDFLEWSSKMSLEDYIRFIKRREIRWRNCYAKTIQLSSEDFVKMVMVDAAFIFTVLLKAYSRDFGSGNDRIFCKPWMIVDVQNDMLLLEKSTSIVHS